MNCAIELTNISKNFYGVPALEAVNLKVERGTVHALLGENGAGKSTLVKIISGAYKKDSGAIYINGAAVEINNPQDAIAHGVSIIYQEFNLIPKMSIDENILLGHEKLTPLKTIDRVTMRKTSQKVLEQLGVVLDGDTLIANLGVAQQQMIEVAKALILNAEILIMDEPTSALTQSEITQLFKVIERLKSSGVSIIYISHRLEEIFEIGDWVTVLRDGQNVGLHNLNDVTSDKLIKLMVARDIIDIYPPRANKVAEEVLKITGLQLGVELKNINFSLHRGEIVGVAGLLGSGRTKLAQAIYGIAKPEQGEIWIHGKGTSIASPQTAIDQGLGFLTEDRKTQGLVMQLSVKNNICLASISDLSKWGVINKAKERQVAKRYIKELHIKTTGLDQSVQYLSGGNQQKVVISKCLCTDADILIFDEPTRGIDIGSKVEIYHLMNKLLEKGAAILMISSELPELLGMCNRILVMHQGAIVGEFRPNETSQEEIMQTALGEYGAA